MNPINNPADIKPNLSTSVFIAEKTNAINRISTRIKDVKIETG